MPLGRRRRVEAGDPAVTADALASRARPLIAGLESTAGAPDPRGTALTAVPARQRSGDADRARRAARSRRRPPPGSSSCALLAFLFSAAILWEGGLARVATATLQPVSGAEDVEDPNFFSHAYRAFLEPAPVLFLPEVLALPQRPCDYAPCEPAVTVVLTVFQRAHVFDEVLDAILNQTADVRAVWVNALGSPHVAVFAEKARLARERDARVRFFSSDENLGYYGRLQLGLQAPTRYVAFVDDDIVLGYNFLANAVHMLGTEEYRGIVGSRGCRMLRPINGTVGSRLDEYNTMDGYYAAVELDHLFAMHILETRLLKVLFREEPHTWKTSEDSQLAYAVRKHAALRVFNVPTDGEPGNSGNLRPDYGATHRSWVDATSAEIWTKAGREPRAMVEYMAARGQEAGEGAAGSSAGGRLEAPEGRMHGSLRDEAHYHQWGRGNRHAHTLDVPPGLWVLFFADSEAHVRALAPIAAELARRYPPALAPTGGREPWDVWYRRPGAGTSQGHECGDALYPRFVLSGRVPAARGPALRALGLDPAAVGGASRPLLFADLKVLRDFPRAPRFADVVSEVMGGLTPHLEAARPLALLLVNDGSAASFAAALAAASLSVRVLEAPPAAGPGAQAPPSMYGDLTAALVTGRAASADELLELRCGR